MPDIYRKSDPPRTREFLSEILADEDAALFVAESDGQIIGFVLVRIRQARDIPIMVPRRYADIEDVAVLKRLHRRGVGRALLEKAHQWALERGVTQVELNVAEFNQGAIAFYEKLGYKTRSRRMWRSV
jgi:ribosomal protein S18 acetylase RimI-like enzyme